MRSINIYSPETQSGKQSKHGITRKKYKNTEWLELDNTSTEIPKILFLNIWISYQHLMIIIYGHK